MWEWPRRKSRLAHQRGAELILGDPDQGLQGVAEHGARDAHAQALDVHCGVRHLQRPAPVASLFASDRSQKMSQRPRSHCVAHINTIHGNRVSSLFLYGVPCNSCVACHSGSVKAFLSASSTVSERPLASTAMALSVVKYGDLRPEWRMRPSSVVGAVYLPETRNLHGGVHASVTVTCARP